MGNDADRITRLARAITGVTEDPFWVERVVGLDQRVEEAEKLLKRVLPLLLTFKYSLPHSERESKALAAQVESFLRRQGK